MPETICPVVHFEMPYVDSKRVTNFYQKVFGWKTQPMGEAMGNYIVVSTAEKDVKADVPRGAIGGGFFPRKPDWPEQHPSIVIAVQGIDAAIKKIKKEGGKVLGEPMMIPGVGLYVSFIDTEGNRVSILEPAM